ncbi:hypothetical protein MSKU15_1258 [Komagataeibacter diospyri]|uniref:hypothetical protein n=1 Tax=Komagataeibacter diospyri TaxID=1932662 RepID=UPI001135369B|nr:hypothetical protein [Komagataeibacter diospyri]GCE89657.1 hypothetical protein MSKU15_1258 [Komagataeibacter diospyri]
MSKGFSFLGAVQNRRAQCLSMAIQHTDATCINDDVDSVIKTAAAFEDYILHGAKPAVDNGQDAGDGAFEPVIGLNAGLGTLDNEPLLDTPVGKAADEADAKPTGTAQDKAAYDIEREKRMVEQMFAHLAKIGLRLDSQKIADDGVDFDWKGRLPADPLLIMIAQAVAEDISSKLGKLFKAGHVCAVHYDEKGFPCVSWSHVSAAA